MNGPRTGSVLRLWRERRSCAFGLPTAPPRSRLYSPTPSPESTSKTSKPVFAATLQDLERDKRAFKKRQEDAGAKVTKKDEREFRRQEEAIKHLPHVIEWASLPDNQ